MAQLKLQPYFPNEVEDVAIEALEELVEKVRAVKSAEELKPLAASIAHHRAVSLLRERFAKKRGEGKTESLDAPPMERRRHEPASDDSPLAIWSKKNWRNGSASRLRNSNRRWVRSFQISFFTVCATRSCKKRGWQSARWAFI